MLAARSKNDRSLTIIRPASGLTSPAIDRSTVVLPDPDAPNRIVKPAAAVNETSSSKDVERRVRTSTVALMPSATPPTHDGEGHRSQAGRGERMPAGQVRSDVRPHTPAPARRRR